MIRPAQPEDVEAILDLVKELAEYEREPDQVAMGPQALAEALFGEPPAAYALVAEESGEIVGLALYFLTFSTWTGRQGLWLEDLYVRPEWRGQGHGKALVAALAALATERGYERLEWAVLEWNEPARAFYRSLGAVSLEEWRTNRLDGQSLRSLGGRPSL